MKEILFYKNKSGKSPIEVFLDSLSFKEVEKVIWVLQLIEESHCVSTKFYKKLVNTDEIVEVRIQHSNNNFRLLGFEHKGKFIVLTNAFRKKDQKIPKKEILLAERRKEEYLSNEWFTKIH